MIAQESIPLAPFPEFSAPRAVTSGPHDHFLANYFAINAWSPDNRYLLTLETDIKDRLPDGAPCTLGLVDLEDGCRFIPVMETRAWNFQEAAMAHWLSADEILYNDLRDRKFVTVVPLSLIASEYAFMPRAGLWNEVPSVLLESAKSASASVASSVGFGSFAALE